MLTGRSSFHSSRQMQPVIFSAEAAAGAVPTRAFVGTKGVGLLKLPSEWVPPFVVLTSAFVDIFSAVTTPSTAMKLLDSTSHTRLQDFASSGRVIVRSNGATEGIQARGQHRSIPASTIGEIDGLVVEMLRSGSDERPLIQRCIEPAIVGHMSNERRFSERSDSWIVEGFLSNEGRPARITAAKALPGTTPLRANSETQALQALRLVARFLLGTSQPRCHVEWVWDNTHVWIVQVDEDCPTRTDPYVHQFLSAKSKRNEKTASTVKVLTHYRAIRSDDWRKLLVPHEFSRLGLPTADIFLLPGEAYRGASSDQLREDLKSFGTAVVIRTDVRPQRTIESEFLATSDPSIDVDDHLRFMESVAKRFRDREIADEEWTFLVAPLVPARASAMVRALPGAPVIQVDALWGFPDGLSYFSGDTYEFKRTGKSGVVRLLRKRHKPYGLFIERNRWAIGHIGVPYDWQPVLDDDEVATIASWAGRVADLTGRQIQLMALARIDGRRGPDACLPFHYTTFEISAPRAQASASFFDKNIQVVSSWDDLTQHRLAPAESLQGLLLRPEQGTLRDTSFLKAVAQFSKERDIPIYFYGSLQGHAYYILSSTGAAVIAVDAVNAPSDVTVYQKLVRDQIPAIVKRAGGIPRVRLLRGDEAKLLLSQKLIEEAFEVWNADSVELAGELADVLDVVDALLVAADIQPEQFAATRLRKREQRGGFQNMVYLEETEFRPFSAYVRRRGELPLLFDDEAASDVATRIAHRLAFDAAERKDGTTIRLSASLIPPVQGGQRLRQIVDRDRSWEAVVTYWPSSIEIVVAPLRGEDSAQMSLFSAPKEGDE